MGDAGPVFQGPDALFRHAPEKIRSDLCCRVRDLAIAKGRPPALAEAMVDMDLVVYRVVNKETGEVAFMSDPELESSDNPALWEKGPQVLESREDRFLEVNGDRAVELRLASGIAEERDELLQSFQLEQPLVLLDASGVETAVYLLNLPIVTGLIFVVGLVALYVEFSAPGISFGGLVAGLCFALFFWSRFLGGTAGWLEVVLFIAGIAFLGIELFVMPGFGVAGITGMLLLLAGVVMASQNHLIPQSPREASQLANSMLVLLGSGIIFAFAAVGLTRYYGSLPLFNRLVLRSPSHQQADGDGKPAKSPSNEDQHQIVDVGDWGLAESPGVLPVLRASETNTWMLSPTVRLWNRSGRFASSKSLATAWWYGKLTARRRPDSRDKREHRRRDSRASVGIPFPITQNARRMTRPAAELIAERHLIGLVWI